MLKAGFPDHNVVQLLIGDERRRGVAYLSETTDDGLRPIGTAWFAEVPWGTNKCVTYAVTARHCVEEHVEENRPLHVELMDAENDYRKIEIKAGKWFRSPKTDVACCRLPIDNIVAISTAYHFGGVRSLWGGLCPGYDVYIVGLFSKAPYRDHILGDRSIEPIVRFGKVALAETDAAVYFDPRDEGKQDKETIIRARLIESNSFGGESGAPVFLYEEYTKDGDDSLYTSGFARRVSIRDMEIHTPLLGMISSHWRIGSEVRSQRRKHIADVGLNSGIAVVVPAEDIEEFLMDDSKVQRDREKIPKGRASEPN